MDIFKDPKFDWLGMKWYFIATSLLLASLGAFSLWGRGLNLGVDFTGGTLVYLKFREQPSIDQIRAALSAAGLAAEQVTRFDEPEKNEVQVKLGQLEEEAAQDLSLQGNRVFEALLQQLGDGSVRPDQLDLNNISRSQLSARLQELDPENLQEGSSLTELENHYQELADRIIELRNQQGLIHDFSELETLGLPAPVLDALRQNFYLGDFTVISVESVGPKVGRELQTRARMAILWSLIGMLIYIAFRFRPIYGVAALVALFHDVFLTVGALSLTQKEISLTVIAALLTLVGYSINDTIVIFDRVRENSKLMRRQGLLEILNTSINQTLNRTVLTSGMTFLAVFALYWFGGPALNGFAFCLVVGIVVGTYSSVAIASPIVLWWDQFRQAREKGRG